MQPVIRPHIGLFQPEATGFAPALQWLKDRGVSAAQMARAFDWKQERVRTILSRHQHRRRLGTPPSNSELVTLEAGIRQNLEIVIPSDELRWELGISSKPDFVVLTDKDENALDSLEDEIGVAQAKYASEYRYADGVRAMRRYISQLGRPRSAKRIRILALLRHHSAWFLLHSGQSRSATDQARRAIALSLVAYKESGSKDDMKRLAESALVLSLAYQLRNAPKNSLRTLKIAFAAYDAAGEKPGSEYFRQMGVAHFQLGNDGEAEKQFKRALLVEAASKRLSSSEVRAGMAGAKQMDLLRTPKWDDAQDHLEQSRKLFNLNTLEFSMSLNWAAAVGIATQSPTIERDALALVHNNKDTAMHFGHQATIRKLLSITPSLKLGPEVHSQWLRFAMYFNASRDE